MVIWLTYNLNKTILNTYILYILILLLNNLFLASLRLKLWHDNSRRMVAKLKAMEQKEFCVSTDILNVGGWTPVDVSAVNEKVKEIF